METQTSTLPNFSLNLSEIPELDLGRTKLIQNQLAFFQYYLPRHCETTRTSLSTKQEEFLTSVASLPSQTDLPTLQSTFLPYQGTSVFQANQAENRFNNFIADLELIKLTANNNLETINQRLTELLTALQTPDRDPETILYIQRELNHILNRAIYTFPHLTTGVEVEFDAAELIQKLENHYKKLFSHSQHGTHQLIEYLNLFKKAHGDYPSNLTLPLPYGFIPAHQSYPPSCDQHNISASTIYPFSHKTSQIPGIALNLKHLWSPPSNELSHIPVQDIKNLKFSTKTGFSPRLDPHLKDDKIHKATPAEHLSAKPHHISHYLTFKLFVSPKNYSPHSFVTFSEEIDSPTLELYKQYFLESSNNRDLWQQEDNQLKRGFLAYDSCMLFPQDTALYELTNLTLPSNCYPQNPNITTIRLYRHLLKENPVVLEKTKVYQGNEIIRRLMEIPSPDRHT